VKSFVPSRMNKMRKTIYLAGLLLSCILGALVGSYFFREPSVIAGLWILALVVVIYCAGRLARTLADARDRANPPEK
jgi:hypothetical protein